MNAVCVLKSGGEYNTDYVNRLYKNLQLHSPFKVVLTCLTDRVSPELNRNINPIKLRFDHPGWWSKMEMFAPALFGLGTFLYFDLDTIVVSDIRKMWFEQKDTFVRDFLSRQQLNSSVMCLTPNFRWRVWRDWVKDPAKWMKENEIGGDQQYLRKFFHDTRPRFWQDYYADYIISYKYHAMESLPASAKVVCFHGQPKPMQLQSLPWIEKNWSK